MNYRNKDLEMSSNKRNIAPIVSKNMPVRSYQFPSSMIS